MNDISSGLVADDPSMALGVFPQELQDKFEIFSYRSAATILSEKYAQKSESESELEQKGKL